MKTIKKISISLSIILLTLLVSRVNAQQAFNGIWTLKERTMIAGPDYANAIPKLINVSCTADSISFSRTSIGQGTDVTTSQTVSINSKPTMFHTAGNRKANTVIVLTADKNGFTETTVYSKENSDNEPEFQTTEIWLLSADSKLTIDRKFQSLVNPEDKWEVKGVFEKQ